MKQLSGTDMSMLRAERPNAPNHIAPIAIYDPSTAPGGAVSFKGILRHLQSRLHLAESFRQRLVTVPFDLDRAYWIEDPAFDLEFHVRHIALPKPGDWRQFFILMARLAARPLDLSKPPWEMYVVEGLDNMETIPNGSFATLLKVHHAAVDGVAGLEMWTAIHDETPLAEPAPVKEPWQPDDVPSTRSLLTWAAIHGIERPLEFGQLARTALPSPRSITSLPGAVVSLRVPDLRGRRLVEPASRFNGPVSPHRVFFANRHPLADGKRIKSLVPGATLNDVFLATVGGGLRYYLKAKDELPELSLTTIMPVSIRREGSAGGNEFSMAYIPLGTDIAEPVARLESVHAATKELKASGGAQDMQTLMGMVELLPGGLMGFTTRNLIGTLNRLGRTVVHTTVTNVPGPAKPLYFAGAEMLTTFGVAPIVDGMGLMNAVSSFTDQVSISVTADRDMMPDPAFYSECLQRSFDELLGAVDR
jgi:diacylglycerol O-acyltransferase / wax synthase